MTGTEAKTSTDAEGLMEVLISEKASIEEVDQEIVVVAGCALGFVSVSACFPLFNELI